MPFLRPFIAFVLGHYLQDFASDTSSVDADCIQQSGNRFVHFGFLVSIFAPVGN
jgi:hypothetical protein